MPKLSQGIIKKKRMIIHALQLDLGVIQFYLHLTFSPRQDETASRLCLNCTLYPLIIRYVSNKLFSFLHCGETF